MGIPIAVPATVLISAPRTGPPAVRSRPSPAAGAQHGGRDPVSTGAWVKE